MTGFIKRRAVANSNLERSDTSQSSERLELTVPAEASRLPELRRVVGEFAVSHGAAKDTIDSAVLAVHEACSNVVRHAYGPESGSLHVKGGCEYGLLQFVVSDNGTPVADPHARKGAGLGLELIRTLANDVDIEGPGEQGTRIRITFRLEGSATGPITDFVG